MFNFNVEPHVAQTMTVEKLHCCKSVQTIAYKRGELGG